MLSAERAAMLDVLQPGRFYALPLSDQWRRMLCQRALPLVMLRPMNTLLRRAREAGIEQYMRRGVRHSYVLATAGWRQPSQPVRPTQTEEFGWMCGVLVVGATVAAAVLGWELRSRG